MNVHPNAPTVWQENKWLRFFKRPTHKQSIAIQTATDPMRHGFRYKGMCRNARILQTTWRDK